MPDRTPTITVNNDWLDGFAGEAQKQGLDQEGAAALLKAAGTIDMLTDQNFLDGFQGELEKQGGLLSSPAIGMLLAYLASKAYGGFQKRWGRSPEQTRLLEQMEEAAGAPDPGRRIGEMAVAGRRRFAARAPAGTLTYDPVVNAEEWARHRFGGQGGYGGGYDGGYGGGYGGYPRPWDYDRY